MYMYIYTYMYIYVCMYVYIPGTTHASIGVAHLSEAPTFAAASAAYRVNPITSVRRWSGGHGANLSIHLSIRRSIYTCIHTHMCVCIYRYR